MSPFDCPPLPRLPPAASRQMPTILVPIGPIGQLCNLSFLMAALFSDILLIRLFLSVRRPPVL